MSQTLGGKIGMLFRMTLHDIVDKALHGNPIVTLNEYLRDHQEAYDQMEEDVAATGGNLKTARRKVQEYTDYISQLNDEIQVILTNADPTDDYKANNKATELVGQEELLENQKRVLDSAEKTYKAVSDTRDKLQGRIISLKNQIALLKAIKSEADVKNMSADILIKSANILSSGSVSVESLAETIRARRDQADARLEMAMEKVNSSGGDNLVQSKADAKLAEIRSRLGIKDEASGSSTTSLDMTPDELQKIAAGS